MHAPRTPTSPDASHRLQFYGGPWMSFLPFGIFVGLVIVTTFVWGSISDGALWVPAFAALLVPFFFARDKRSYTDAVIGGMASREALTPVVCWLFAGVFSNILRSSGLADALAGLAAGAGMGAVSFAVVAFLSCALFATATGTGFGTIATGMGVLYPAGIALGCDPALLAGAVVSGAAFGDNLAPISDTTICSAASQGIDVAGVVRSRLKYALVAGAITVIAIVVLGTMLDGPQTPAGANATRDFDPKALWMLVPVALTVAAAAKTSDIVVATALGIVVSCVLGVALGQFAFIQIDPGSDSAAALVSVAGAGLDRTVGGIVYGGLANMVQVCVLALLLFGSISIMRAGGGDALLLRRLDRVVHGPRGAELAISAMVVGLSGVMGLNAPAILAVGGSFARPLAQRYGISPYRTANLLDAQSNTLVYALPWTPALVYTVGFSSVTAAPLTAVSITAFSLYSYAILAVMLVSVALGIGRRDGQKGAADASSAARATP